MGQRAGQGSSSIVTMNRSSWTRSIRRASSARARREGSSARTKAALVASRSGGEQGDRPDGAIEEAALADAEVGPDLGDARSRSSASTSLPMAGSRPSGACRSLSIAASAIDGSLPHVGEAGSHVGHPGLRAQRGKHRRRRRSPAPPGWRVSAAPDRARACRSRAAARRGDVRLPSCQSSFAGSADSIVPRPAVNTLTSPGSSNRATSRSRTLRVTPDIALTWVERMMYQLLHVSVMSGVTRSVLERLVARFDEPGLVNVLTAGLGTIESALPANELWQLGRTVVASPSLTAQFDERGPDLERRLRADPAARAFVGAFDAFLAAHGARGPDEWELASPTWGS